MVGHKTITTACIRHTKVNMNRSLHLWVKLQKRAEPV